MLILRIGPLTTKNPAAESVLGQRGPIPLMNKR